MNYFTLSKNELRIRLGGWPLLPWLEGAVVIKRAGVKAVSQRNQKSYFLIVLQQLHSNAQINVPTPPHNPAGRCKSSRSWVNSD